MVVGFQKECDMIYAIIPARSGSKSIRDKNIIPLAEYPLLAYSIMVAKQVPEIDRVFVSTDSLKYADIARKYWAEVPFLRPAAISGDDSTDIEFIQHFLGYLRASTQELPEYVVHLRPTTPMRNPDDISEAIELIRNDPKATALRSVSTMAQSVYKHFEIEDGLLKTVFTRSSDLDIANKPRQGYPTTYDANGYVDILKVDHVILYNKIHGNHVIPFLVPQSLDIDGKDELKLAQFLGDWVKRMERK